MLSPLNRKNSGLNRT
jgi:hypothetical protein